MGMELQDAAALQELSHRNGERWGTNSALWVIAAVIVIGFVAYVWSRNCNEKVGFATSVARLDGRLDCVEPQVRTLNQQMYGAAQAFAGLTVGVDNINRNFGQQIGQLNETVFYNPVNNGCTGTTRSGCCGTPNRVFTQTQTFTPSTQEVTVTESCGNDRC